MQKRNLKVWGIVCAVLVAAVWLSFTDWQYGARTWGFRMTHQVVAVKEVQQKGQYMPYTYRDVYFITQPGSETSDIRACAVAFGHNVTSETQFTRCHAFLSIGGAQIQADNAAVCEVASSRQTPYMDSKNVRVVFGQGKNCDVG